MPSKVAPPTRHVPAAPREESQRAPRRFHCTQQTAQSRRERARAAVHRSTCGESTVAGRHQRQHLLRSRAQRGACARQSQWSKCRATRPRRDIHDSPARASQVRACPDVSLRRFPLHAVRRFTLRSAMQKPSVEDRARRVSSRCVAQRRRSAVTRFGSRCLFRERRAPSQWRHLAACRSLQSAHYGALSS